ncbi:phosphatidylserine decarboxylase 1 [Coemansia sp. RSA 1722]|nr:phosphatidylserine decarboxylase 1 [Coemansia sp. RSA 486]KAJ2233461.1 phosphatidylserine decarboxylase 1 [Coemansia sp. RSA 485]KAJ2591736.1 phosphatidylserine decarboxylase 1 [Coemansia sp. RSA 1722]
MASNTTSYVYGIDRHTLCLTALHHPSHNRFALATLGITEPAELHLVDFDSYDNVLSSHVYKHTCGIRSLSNVSWDPNLLLATDSNGGSAPAQLLKIPDKGDTMETIAVLPQASETMAHTVVAHPSTYCKDAAVVPLPASATGVAIYDLGQSSGPVIRCSIGGTGARTLHHMEDIEAVAFHPSAATLLSTTDGTCLRSWDTRSDPQRATLTMSIECAHSARIRTLDYNPNLPYIVATAADDGYVRIWDTRAPSAPLLEIANHSHWVYSVAFNPNHDQLLLSAGADGLVNLESVVSVSSAQVVATHHQAEEDTRQEDASDASSVDGGDSECGASDIGSGQATDGLVAQFDDHETSVYTARWSHADPWIFASLSFDGRMVINSVPREEKYKILL